MGILLSQNERMYVQVTHPYAAAIPNSTGTATLAGSDACKHIRLELPGFGGNVITSAAKTGALGRLAGIEGRSGGNAWRAEIPFQMSGTAGTPPDMDAILEAIVGQAGVDSGGTSVVYSLSDAVPGLTLYSFRTVGGSATNVAQRCAWGALVDDFEIATVDGELVIRVGGPCSFVLPSIGFASFSAAQKAGLSAFPSEPSPTYVGNIIPGFIGSLTINAVSTFKVESFSIRGRLNRSLRYAFGSRVPTVPIAGVRDITASIRIFEENEAAVNTLRDLQRSKTAVDISLVFGDTAGYTATFALNGVVFGSESLDDSSPEYVLGFADTPDSMTNSTTSDEMVITLT